MSSQNYICILSRLRRRRPREWICGHSGGRREREELRTQRWQCTPRCVSRRLACLGLVLDLSLGTLWLLGSGTCRNSMWAFSLWEPVESDHERVLLGQGLAWNSDFLTVLIGGQYYTQSVCERTCASFTSALGDLICWRGSTCNPCLEKCLLNGKSPGCDPLDNKTSNGVRPHCSPVYV